MERYLYAFYVSYTDLSDSHYNLSAFNFAFWPYKYQKLHQIAYFSQFGLWIKFKFYSSVSMSSISYYISHYYILDSQNIVKNNILNLKWKIISLFTHPHVAPNLYDFFSSETHAHKETFWRMLVTEPNWPNNKHTDIYFLTPNYVKNFFFCGPLPSDESRGCLKYRPLGDSQFEWRVDWPLMRMTSNRRPLMTQTSPNYTLTVFWHKTHPQQKFTTEQSWLKSHETLNPKRVEFCCIHKH